MRIRQAPQARQWMRPLAFALPLIILLALPQDCAAAQRTLPPTSADEFSHDRPGMPVLPPETRTVHISLEEHRLYVLEGERVPRAFATSA